MTKLLVFQHSPYEPLGLLIPIIRSRRMRIRYVNFHRGDSDPFDIKDYDGLIVLGGNMHPNETQTYPHLNTEIDAIKQAIQLNIPTLGICLGAQLLAKAIGGHCHPLSTPEFGWHKVQFSNENQQNACLSCFNPEEILFQWHQFTFDLPKEVTAIATSESKINQAFHYQGRHIGLQFHLEADQRLLQRWLSHQDYLEHLQKHLSHLEIERIRAQSYRHQPRSERLACDVFHAFLDMINPHQVRLGSMHAGR